MQGAMKPGDFAPDMHPPEHWAIYAIMSESVECDPAVVKAQNPTAPGQIQGTTIQVNRPRNEERASV